MPYSFRQTKRSVGMYKAIFHYLMVNTCKKVIGCQNNGFNTGSRLAAWENAGAHLWLRGLRVPSSRIPVVNSCQSVSRGSQVR